MGTARGVVIGYGGYINVIEDRAQRLLQRMNLVMWKGTTKVKVLLSNFEKLKKTILIGCL